MYVAQDKLPVICRLERTYKNIVLHYKGCTTSMHYELGSRSMHYEFGWFINECKPVLGQRPSPRRLPLPERLPGRQRTDMVGRETAQGKRPVISCLGPAKKLYRFEQNGYGWWYGSGTRYRSVFGWSFCSPLELLPPPRRRLTRHYCLILSTTGTTQNNAIQGWWMRGTPNSQVTERINKSVPRSLQVSFFWRCDFLVGSNAG